MALMGSVTDAPTHNDSVEQFEDFQFLMEYGVASEHTAVEGPKWLGHTTELWTAADRAA